MKDLFVAVGGGNEIGASCYLLRIAGRKFLIDAGMRFDHKRAFPDLGYLNSLIGGMESLDAFLLTHAHLDHSGAITRLHYESPHLPMFTTRPTLDLARVMLTDALHVSKKQKTEDWSVIDASRELLEETLASFQPVSFGEWWDLDSCCRFSAVSAGHILGAASYLIDCNGMMILHTGDFCLHSQRTIAGMDIDALPDIDLLVLESTYVYQPEPTLGVVEDQYYVLARLVNEIVSQGGRVLIPAFALGRAQEIAALFNDLMEEELIAPFDVLVDGLVKAVCQIYEDHRDCLRARLTTRAGHAIYGEFVTPTTQRFFPTPRIVSALDPGCIIASSGMLLDRTRSAAYASVFLENCMDAIVFSGYLDEESPGRRLRNLKTLEDKRFRIGSKRLTVKARVEQYHLSAHASSKDLRKVIRKVQPKQVILIHRDDRFDGEADFVNFMMQMEREGVQFHLSANNVPIYL